MQFNSDTNMASWFKIVSAWAAGAWATFSLHGFLQVLVLMLTVAVTALQLYKQIRELRRQNLRDAEQRIDKEDTL
jgi:hypothetical protein